MKVKTLFTTVCLYASLYSFSQEAIPEFGQISVSDLQMKECSFAKEAPAFYMINYIKTDLGSREVDYEVTVKRRIRIKILNPKGYEYASVTLQDLGFNQSKITGIEAFIYTLGENGAIVKTKVEKKDIFKIKTNKNNDQTSIKFTFPGLKPGCIIEYQYEHLKNTGYNFTIEPWFFQHKIPVALSYCEVDHPKSQFLTHRLIGLTPENKNNYTELPVDSSDSNLKEYFFMKNIPSFKPEPMMTSIVDYLNRIEFSFQPKPPSFVTEVKTIEQKWQMISDWISAANSYGLQYDIPIDGTEKKLDSIKQLPIKKDRIQSVYQYVRNEINWNRYQSKTPHDVNEVWKNKTGNSASINMIILNLLKKSGIACYPVLLSTRENGKTDPDFASLSQFNGLDVLAIDSNNYYVLDGSSKNQSCEIPPLNIVNRNVFVVTPKEYKWVNITENRALIKDSSFITASLDKDGNMKGEAITTSFNFARDLRLSETGGDDKTDNDLTSKDISEFKIDSAWFLNKENDALPLVMYARFHFPLTNTNNFYFFNSTLFNSMKRNPLTDTSRVTDLDFICNQDYKQVIKLMLPANITMESIPKSIIIRMFDTSMVYSRSIIQRGQVIQIENEFTINKSLYTAEEYASVWQFFKKVYGLLAEEIVLNKKD